MVEKVNVIDVSAFVNKRDYDSKIKDIKGKMPSITDLGTTAALNDVKNEMPNVSYLVKKIDYDAKIKHLKVNISPHLIMINLRM